MRFFRRAAGKPEVLGILAGAFNPLTRAHLELARAGLQEAAEVVFVLPRRFPHKNYTGASFDARIRMLETVLQDEPRFSIASTSGGLFLEIARECRRQYGPDTRLLFLCGRDAAERIVTWDYGDPNAFLEMLREFELRVASRRGDYEPPLALKDRIRPLPMPAGYEEISASEVRGRITRGEPWEHLVPERIVPTVKEYYRALSP